MGALGNEETGWLVSGHRPLAGVDEGVVSLAKQYEVVEVGFRVVFVKREVVSVTPTVVPCTRGEDTVLVADDEGTALRFGYIPG